MKADEELKNGNRVWHRLPVVHGADLKRTVVRDSLVISDRGDILLRCRMARWLME